MTKPNSQSGFLNPCVLRAFAPFLCGGLFALVRFAVIPTPTSAATATPSPAPAAVPTPLLPAISPPGVCPTDFVITPLITLPSGQTVRCPAGVAHATVSSSQAPPPCVVPGVNDWCPAWNSAPYDGPGHKTDAPGNATCTKVMGTSPDGNLVFVAGTSDQDPDPNTTNYQVVTIAYDAMTGRQVWTASYTAPSGLQSYAQSLAVAGSRVFVAIYQSNQTEFVSTIVAYDASTGNLLWPAAVSFADGTGFATSIAASPDGARVYAVGSHLVILSGGAYRVDAAIIAYDGATGTQLWIAATPGPAGSPPSGFADGFGVAAVGNKVYMAAVKLNSQYYISELDLLVVDACTGQTLVTGSRAIHADDQSGFAVSADGSRAFMEFQDLLYDSSGALHQAVMAVAGFDAQTGQSLWVSDYLGPNPDSPLASGSIPWSWEPIAASPDGSRVFAATESSDGDFGLAGSGFTTAAYDGATGAQLWASAYNTNTPFIYLFTGPMVNVDPTGRAVYTTGPAAQAETFATIAQDPATGAAIKTAIYTDGFATANATAVSPDGTRLLVGAVSTSSVNTSTGSFNSDIVTLAYDTGLGTPTPSPVHLSSVVSRATHGSAGTFDVDLTSGKGIECRSGGANGDYALVFAFPNSLTSIGGASVTSGTGSVASGNISCNDAHSYIVKLTGVANAQTITVTLSSVGDVAGNFSSAVSAQMGVLIGDVNASGVVTSGDTNLCKAQALQPLTSANFRNDVNASGSITTGDVNIIKQNALSHL